MTGDSQRHRWRGSPKCLQGQGFMDKLTPQLPRLSCDAGHVHRGRRGSRAQRAASGPPREPRLRRQEGRLQTALLRSRSTRNQPRRYFDQRLPSDALRYLPLQPALATDRGRRLLARGHDRGRLPSRRRRASVPTKCLSLPPAYFCRSPQGWSHYAALPVVGSTPACWRECQATLAGSRGELAMATHQIEVIIPDDRRLIVEVPETIRSGPATLILLPHHEGSPRPDDLPESARVEARERWQTARAELARDPRPFRQLSPEERQARLRLLEGIGRGLLSSSEDFSRRKAEEIEIEDRKLAP